MVWNYPHSVDLHTARFNEVEAIKELTLVEEHLKSEPCADCITKHLLKTEALLEEGASLG